MSSGKDAYIDIQHYLARSLELKQVQRLGLCRLWTKEAMLIADDFATKQNLPIKFEAREVEIEPFLFHTFLWALLVDDEPYIYDGVGTGSHLPFFGFESNATHLQNSNLDPINYYLSIKTNK